MEVVIVPCPAAVGRLVADVATQMLVGGARTPGPVTGSPPPAVRQELARRAAGHLERADRHRHLAAHRLVRQGW
ncbi:hypothetical protein O2V63_20105 [Modestobacter sp. VKM Ac-2977]|uniref:hypothetical protein n=1 Tax=Modestobacter sp. VKM Ac-2977 TaxID=3004131 RepID=UPI0022AA801A|nr:hypothetical protein [Modestobacter sp. VKM Ac-2977]MCZ2822648.1 hypothetical protein [Modestobacter sp. VKM Ac-2977]